MGSQLALCGQAPWRGMAMWCAPSPSFLHPGSCLCCFLVSRGVLLLLCCCHCTFPAGFARSAGLSLKGSRADCGWCGQASLILSDLPGFRSRLGGQWSWPYPDCTWDCQHWWGSVSCKVALGRCPPGDQLPCLNSAASVRTAFLTTPHESWCIVMAFFGGRQASAWWAGPSGKVGCCFRYTI